VVETVASRLVVLAPDGTQAGSLVLVKDRLLIGRDPQADVHLDDPGVSWHHAELARVADRWFLRDLGSTNGTTVGGTRIDRSTEVGGGALIGVGRQRLRLDGPSGGAHPPTHAFPATAPAGGIWVPSQSAHEIINHEGDNIQYFQARESFLREVAATRTRARWFVWLGLFLVVGGLAAVLSQLLPFLSAVSGSVSTQTQPDSADLDLFGPVTLLGYVAALAGAVLVVVGIVLHVTATARRRQVEQRFPVPHRYR
jgi:hypothetical protein